MLQFIIVIVIIGLATLFLVSSFIKKTRKGGCSCEGGDIQKKEDCHCEGCPLNGKCTKREF